VPSRRKVGSVMTTDVTVAAKLLEEHHFYQLPVVDDEGKLVGVVSRPDLLRVFLRTDRDIRDEVREEVLLREMAMDRLLCTSRCTTAS